MRGALACTFSPTAAQAWGMETVSHFALECCEAEPRAKSPFGLEIAPGAGAFTARLADDTASVGADLSQTAEGGTVLVARDESAVRLASVVSGGAARHTPRLADGPLVVVF